MAELKTAPKVDYFYDPSEWEFMTDDPEIIVDSFEGLTDISVIELATLRRGPTYYAFRDYDKGTRFFDDFDEAEAAYEKMLADQDIEE